MCQGYGRGVAECRNFARSIARRFANFFQTDSSKALKLVRYRRANVSFDRENGNEKGKERA